MGLKQGGGTPIYSACTSIFVLSQNESQGSITKLCIWIVSSQPYYCLDKGEPLILVKPQSEIFLLAM